MMVSRPISFGLLCFLDVGSAINKDLRETLNENDLKQKHHNISSKLPSDNNAFSEARILQTNLKNQVNMSNNDVVILPPTQSLNAPTSFPIIDIDGVSCNNNSTTFVSYNSDVDPSTIIENPCSVIVMDPSICNIEDLMTGKKIWEVCQIECSLLSCCGSSDDDNCVSGIGPQPRPSPKPIVTPTVNNRMNITILNPTMKSPTKRPTLPLPLPTQTPKIAKITRRPTQISLPPSSLPREDDHLEKPMLPNNTPSFVMAKVTMNPTDITTLHPSPSPSEYNSQFPTFGPTPNPTESPTGLPTKYDSRSPTGLPTKIFSQSPTIITTPNPTRLPTRLVLTGLPTGHDSQPPTINPNPTEPPSRSTMPPTSIPSPNPTGTPSFLPSPEPTLDPSPFPSYTTDSLTALPTKNPTQFPTNIPPKNSLTDFPTRFMIQTNHPTKVPSSSLTDPQTQLPSHNAKDMTTNETVTLYTNSLGLMDSESESLFEAMTMTFISENLPETNSVNITVTSVQVISQEILSEERWLEGKATQLVVDLTVRVTVFPGNPPNLFSLSESIGHGFRTNFSEYETLLAANLALFSDKPQQIGFAKGVVPQNVSNDEVGSFSWWVIACIIVGGATLLAMAAIWTVRRRRSIRGGSIDNSISSSVSPNSMESGNDSTKRRFFSEIQSQQSDELSTNVRITYSRHLKLLSFIGFSYTFAHFLQMFIPSCSKFKTAELDGSTPKRSLTTTLPSIAEHKASKMEDCPKLAPQPRDYVTAQTTPRGTPFLQLDTTSTISSKPKISVAESLLAESLSEAETPNSIESKSHHTPKNYLMTSPSDVTTPKANNTLRSKTSLPAFDSKTPKASNLLPKTGPKLADKSPAKIRSNSKKKKVLGTSKKRWVNASVKNGEESKNSNPQSDSEQYEVKHRAVGSYMSEDSDSWDSEDSSTKKEKLQMIDSLMYSMSEESTRVGVSRIYILLIYSSLLTKCCCCCAHEILSSSSLFNMYL